MFGHVLSRNCKIFSERAKNHRRALRVNRRALRVNRRALRIDASGRPLQFGPRARDWGPSNLGHNFDADPVVAARELPSPMCRGSFACSFARLSRSN
eukprot:8399533-Pyramimonas_sp.AAC.1